MTVLKRTLAGTLIVLILGALIVSTARCRSLQVPAARQLSEYDPAPYAAALEAVVVDGLVDYAALRAEHQSALDRYLDAISRFGPDSSPDRFDTDDAKLAYYINAYNAVMLRKWLDAGAGRDAGTSRTVNRLWFFFDLWPIDGTWRSLDGLEQEIIRPRFEEPRVHFALVCGAMSCPPLLDEPFDGARLDAQLDALGRRWMNEPDGLQVREDGSVWMSSIFDWYRGDFEAMGGLEGVIDRYLADDDPRRQRAQEAAREGRIRFLEYDWSINRAPRNASGGAGSSP